MPVTLIFSDFWTNYGVLKTKMNWQIDKNTRIISLMIYQTNQPHLNSHQNFNLTERREMRSIQWWKYLSVSQHVFMLHSSVIVIDKYSWILSPTNPTKLELCSFICLISILNYPFSCRILGLLVCESSMIGNSCSREVFNFYENKHKSVLVPEFIN